MRDANLLGFFCDMEISATANGPSDTLAIGCGCYWLAIEADTWGGATAALESSITSEFTGVVDPYSETPGATLSRTANGPLVLVRGGAKYRLNVTSYSGSTDGLRLVVTIASS
jgi:hypothetical protein